VTTPDIPTEGTSADHERSGADVTEAVEVAERGSSVQEVHDRPEDTKPGTAPVEQTAGDPEMTEGQVVLGEGEGEGEAETDRAPGIDPREAGSGGAQSAPGARVSDRVSGGEPKPGGEPFDR
jgi:hypothetical protein